MRRDEPDATLAEMKKKSLGRQQSERPIETRLNVRLLNEMDGFPAARLSDARLKHIPQCPKRQDTRRWCNSNGDYENCDDDDDGPKGRKKRSEARHSQRIKENIPGITLHFFLPRLDSIMQPCERMMAFSVTLYLPQTSESRLRVCFY